MILIVDDQKVVGTGLERLLRYAGHDSLSVTRGAEAIAMLHVHKPSLLILDVNMPDMDGLEVLRSIKQHDELKDVRVLMYSADAQETTILEARRLGALDFIIKGSVGSQKLVERIAELSQTPAN